MRIYPQSSHAFIHAPATYIKPCSIYYGGGSGGTNASSGSGMGATKKNMPIGPVLNRPMDEVKTYYTIGKELGRGQFGVTYLCTEKSTGKK